MVSHIFSFSYFIDRYNPDTNLHFRITEERGEVLLCNSRGVLIKPFDPNLTGKFDHGKRIKIMQ